MNFSLGYLDSATDNSERSAVFLLSVYLNDQLMEKFHGWAYEQMFITLINNAEPDAEWKAEIDNGRFADIELPVTFADVEDPVQEINQAFEKVMEAVSIADTLEIKGTKTFLAQQLLDDLKTLQQTLPKSAEAYEKLVEQLPDMIMRYMNKRINGCIKACKEHPLPHNNHIKRLQISDHFGLKALMPYRYMYAEVFSTLLRDANISTPEYHEIYIAIDNTLNEAKTEIASNTSSRYTYCTLNFERYQAATPDEKEQMLLDSLIDGLRLIADFDHLDTEKIEAVIDTVRNTKCQTPLTYRIEENSKYHVHIHYQMVYSAPDQMEYDYKTPFYITLTNKATGKSITETIDHLGPYWVSASIDQVEITENAVEITGAQKGEATRRSKGLPDRYSFPLAPLH